MTLLDEAGWRPGPDGFRLKDGQRLAFTVMFLPNITTHRELALALRSDLAQVGVDVAVEGVDSSIYPTRLGTDGWLHNLGNPYDPDMQLYSRYHSRFALDGDSKTNPAALNDPRVDAALEAGRASPEPHAREAAYRELQRLLGEDAAYLHLGVGNHTVIAEVLLDDAVSATFTLGPAHSLPLVTRAYQLTTTASGPLRRHATGTWGLVALLTGDPTGLAASEAVARELMSGPAEPSEVRWGFGPLGTFARAALYAERFDDAEHALAVDLAPAERMGAAEVTARHLVVKAVLAARQGRLADALATADQASTWAELAPTSEAPAGFAHAEVLLLLGRLVECADWCRRTEAIAAARGQSFVLLGLWHVRAQLRGALGPPCPERLPGQRPVRRRPPGDRLVGVGCCVAAVLVAARRRRYRSGGVGRGRRRSVRS